MSSFDVGEVRVDTYSNSMVNSQTTYRLLHMPTGLVVEGKTQHGKLHLKTKHELMAQLEQLVNESGR